MTDLERRRRGCENTRERNERKDAGNAPLAEVDDITTEVGEITTEVGEITTDSIRHEHYSLESLKQQPGRFTCRVQKLMHMG